MGSTSFPIDLVLFGMIAAFLVLRLRSILGRRTGFERSTQAFRPATEPNGTVIDGQAEEPVAASRAVPEPASALGQTLVQMHAIDHSFTPASFLDGAEKAFSFVVTAFAAGKRDTLRPLLGPDMFAAFDTAITAREAAHETQSSEIRAISSATIEAAILNASLALIDVRFVSDQVSYVTGADGQLASGTEAVTELDDTWTFERNLSQRDPTWRLVSARSA